MKDEHHVSETICSQSRLNILIAANDCDTFDLDAEGAPAASVILYNTNTLPLYPAPVGRRADWTFVEKDFKGAAKQLVNQTAEYPTAKESSRLRTHDEVDIGKPRTLTLDLLPEDVQASLLAPRNIPRSHTEAAVASSSSTTMSHANASNSRTNTLLLNQRHQPQRAPHQPLSSHHSHHHHTGHLYNHQHHPDSLTGLYGWRKKCLFLLMFGLLTLIVTNLALTLWILKVMDFSTEGMGSLKVVAGGLQLSGQALVLDMLKVSSIRSRQGQPISIESSRNFSVNTRDWEGRIENQMFLGHDRFDVLTHNLKIYDAHGAVLLAADKNEVRIGANVLRLDGEGGVVVRESVQTSLVRAEPGRELKFESPTRSLHMNAGQDILIKSAAGSLDANCLNDIRLHSEAGSIRLDSSSIVMPNLKTAQPPLPGASTSHAHTHKVYQLCVCANGKLFMAQSHSVCAGDEASVCR